MRECVKCKKRFNILDNFNDNDNICDGCYKQKKSIDKIEFNKIYNMDCIEGMRLLDDNCIDLIITSPPYNIRNTVGGGFTSKKGLWNNPNGLKIGYDNYSDDMSYDTYVSWQRKCLAEMMRTLKETGAIFYNHKWRVQNGLIQDRKEIVSGFPVRQIIIWWRKCGMNFNDSYFLPTYEVIYLIAKPKFKLTKGGNKIGDVWQIPPDKNNKHPASFPVELVKRCISSTDAKIILDPFVGSGTVAVACKMLGRKFIGFDINKTYCNLANKRLEQQLKETNGR